MAKLYIICGHGAGDPGACGNGFKEAERVRALAARIQKFGGNHVVIGDQSRNWYSENLISKLKISKDWKFLELHMDSFTDASAKGGHVIIRKGYKPDEYDQSLANVMKQFFPGRSSLIVERDDLANPNRAAAAGYNYRLMECGFITNKTDVNTFNNRMDEIAKAILYAFNIVPGSKGSDTSETVPECVTELAKMVIQGVYGNGAARKENIYKAVQNEVDRLMKKR